MIKTFIILLLTALPAWPATYEYTGPNVASENGVLGLGQWLIAGSAANLWDNDDSTGVYYPYTANVYGGPVAGAFSLRPLDDGAPWLGSVANVEMRVRVKAATATGNYLQTFVHRDPIGFSDLDAWGYLSFVSVPWNQWPTSPPYVLGEQWAQDAWTEIRASFPWTGTHTSWTREAVFSNCYGIWVVVPVNGGLTFSEWKLVITTTGV